MAGVRDVTGTLAPNPGFSFVPGFLGLGAVDVWVLVGTPLRAPLAGGQQRPAAVATHGASRRSQTCPRLRAPWRQGPAVLPFLSHFPPGLLL